MSATDALPCRPGCGACCIAPSITRPLPGMPQGKPAGVRCVQLTDDMRCAVFGQPERPDFCGGLRPAADMCGADREHAIAWLARLEQATAPQPAGGLPG
ncbi:YkgJ family cysteine cluster protein [Bordetella genomosp. 11]|uniref:Zinc/iron-chelating domain-containing protein n=1 Tax=Bordetella genomosp. 11 TaxID=1416808 RepID=A0A261UQA4_9BORD|nr:YkgJ family cysteine cluster protein [Bordetella genomosp. 11]OZI63450.1 zinc/iron-chelating domain-containing protein [Bordetella genomosp. 11]